MITKKEIALLKTKPSFINIKNVNVNDDILLYLWPNVDARCISLLATSPSSIDAAKSKIDTAMVP